MTIDVTEDVDIFFELKADGGFADSATYTPQGGSAGSTFPVVLDEMNLKGNPLRDEMDQDFIMCKTRTADVLTVSTAHNANRASRDIFTINEVDYGIIKKQPDNHGVTYFELERQTRRVL